MSKETVELLPILLDGKPFTIDDNGTMAVNQDGKAVRLSDQEKKKSRFK